MKRREFSRLLGLGVGALTLPSWMIDGAPRAWRGTSARRVGTAGASGAAGTSGRQALVDRERLLTSLRGLRRFGSTPEGGNDRVAYSEADLEARAYVKDLMREAELEVRVDAGGNLLGSRAGGEGGLSPILFGSHIDSVPDGGHYDGPVGSLAAIEAAHAIADHGLVTRHPLEVVIFQNEEGGLYGSRILGGELQPRELDLVSASGMTVREGIRRLGGDPERLDRARREPGDVAAYLELHIEQGEVLESRGIDIGVVQGIVGIRQWDVTVEGFANHAGTTPMDRRQDALLAASRYVQAVNRIVTSRPGPQVGTVGRIRAEPGAPNVIPGRVSTSLELRDLEMATIRELYDEIRREAEAIGRATGTEFDFERTIDLDPAPVDESVQDVIESSATELGLSALRMPSGAGHDAQSLARIAPIGMLFVPSVGGVSHSPEELTPDDDVVNGANVLLRSVLALDERL